MEFLVLLALVLAVVALIRANGARDRVDLLSRRIDFQENELRQFRGRSDREPTPKPGAAPMPGSPPAHEEAAVPPPLPVRTKYTAPAPQPIGERGEAEVESRIAANGAPASSGESKPPINWEQFMGAKMFAWIGGLALFLGVGFFVKYSFDHDLISPAMRVTIGFLVGVGLLGGGVMVKRKALAVIAQTLCATGVLILYAVTFACHGLYHFPFFGIVPTFLLMTLITAVAFVLAVRLEAQVVAVLGMLGGFLTPVLLSTGRDNVWGLFGYIALLDAGLLAVVLHRRWNYLAPLGAAGTAIMQVAWAGRFFAAARYFEGNKILIPMAVLLGFVALFAGAVFRARRRGRTSGALTWSAVGLAGVAFSFAFFFLAFAPLAQRPLLLFGFAFLVNLAVLALVLLDARTAVVQPLSGLVVFLLLAIWTMTSLTTGLLYSALGLFLVFTVFHAGVPLALQRMKGAVLPAWWSHVFPALGLLLALGPVLQTTGLSFLVWPFVFLIDVLAVSVAVLSATLLPILVVLVLTLVVTGVWIFRIPETLTGLPASLWMLGGFAVFFLLASAWVVRKLAGRAGEGTAPGELPNLAGQFASPELLRSLLPASSVTMPFLLLIMVTARLPIADPSPIFGLALLLIVLLLGVTKFLAIEVLPLVGLFAALALEHAWHFEHFDAASAARPLTWYLVFYAVFSIFPFVFRKEFAGKTIPWAAAALAGPFHFYLIHGLVKAAHPNPAMGLLPAAFAVPSLCALVVLGKTTSTASTARSGQLAWFGGVALFFITLVFPIQFDRQWITIGWALEGAALCWLFRRVDHPGLRLTGVGLLVVAFARLAVNPTVLSYHARSEVPIFNWYLYAYGIVTACLFAGAFLLAPPRHQILGRNAPPVLAALGTILAFLLVNIEIADYFTAAGAPVVTLEFSGNLARDMTYSVAWALFALLLLIVGIARRLAPVRYAGIGLLSVTLLKLFLHDLSQLNALYRIGALVAVAIVAMVASFLYQRFLSTGEDADATKTTPPPP
jgi:hypothetical protein